MNDTIEHPGKPKQKTRRARKQVDERYDHKVFVYVSEEQYTNLISAADKQSLSVSCLIREVCTQKGLI
jgi:hypothetical protein